MFAGGYNSVHSHSSGDLPVGSARSSTTSSSASSASSASLATSARRQYHSPLQIAKRASYPNPKLIPIHQKRSAVSLVEKFAAERPSHTEKLPAEVIKAFEERYQINVPLDSLYANSRGPDVLVLNSLIKYTNKFYGKLENSLTVFKFCCLARQKHKTLEVIGLLICDIEQIYNILEYFCFLTKDYGETFFTQLIGLKDETHNVYKNVTKMLKFSILPPVDPKFIKEDVYKISEALASVVLDILSYLIQRLLLFASIKKNKALLGSLANILKSVDEKRRGNFEITFKLEQWLDEESVCVKCSRNILLQPCIKELQTKKKWHLNCCSCSLCGEQLFQDSLMYAVLEPDDTIKCSSCNFVEQDSNTLVFNQFSRSTIRQQCVSLLKANMLKIVRELEDDNYGYICQEWIQYWRMDEDDLKRYDRNTQKAQSAIFELIHRQQFFVDTATYFLSMGEKYLQEAQERPDELDPVFYELIFKPIKELRKIHKRLLLSPMTRFLSDQGMIIKNQIFKLYLNWINKSYYAYEEYLIKLAESKLMQDVDKVKEVPHLQLWIKEQKSAKLEKLLSGEFYYQIIQTKEILRNLEKYIDALDPENQIVFQTSMLVDKFSHQLHSVLDKAITRAYITRIRNLEVKRSDVYYKKHAFVKYKSKLTNEIMNCCLILLNMCLVITKLSVSDSTFIKFAPLIYAENLEYERIDAKVFISDRTKKDMEPYKVHFRTEEDALNWININL